MSSQKSILLFGIFLLVLLWAPASGPGAAAVGVGVVGVGVADIGDAGEQPPPPPDGAPGGLAPGERQAPAADPLATAPPRLPIWRDAAVYPYLSSLYTHSDILLFSYSDGTEFQVTNASGRIIWQGTLSAGRHKELTPGGGIYTASATHPFSVVVGDQLTDFVWGYYAIDQNGRGLSTLFHTYQANWTNRLYDPHFTVFAYSDNTAVDVVDSNTGTLLWHGVLNDGEHYDNRDFDDRFLTVRASKPVSALSYTDQGYFVPSGNGTFAGNRFHTYIGNSGNWMEFLNIMAYDNTGYTVTDSRTGARLRSGSLQAGQAVTMSGLNSRFVTVETSGTTTVSVQPAPRVSENYYHSLYAQDSTGTGIGTNFLLPAIANANLVFFAYDNGTNVTIVDDGGRVAYRGLLNQGDWDSIRTTSTYYTIRSTGRISAVLDFGNRAGADFAPIFYSTFNVQVVNPAGDSYAHGSTMVVSAYVTQLGQGVRGATVEGRIEVGGPSDTLNFPLNDGGRNGDATAGDAIYSAEVPLPHAAAMPGGNYNVFVTAQRTDPDGVAHSGTGVSNFTLAGQYDDAPEMRLTLAGDAPTSGDTVTLQAEVVYDDGVLRPTTAVIARVTTPSLAQEEVTLSHMGGNLWQTSWTFSGGGRYLFDVRAVPPASAFHATGYASRAVNVLNSAAGLVITPDPLPGAVARGSLQTIGLTVRAGGRPTNEANVFAEISPGDLILPFTRNDNGHYVAPFAALEAGVYTFTFYASAPYWVDSSTTATLVVSNAGQSMLDSIDTLARMTNMNLDRVLETAAAVAEDGDWFRGKIPGDVLSLGINLFLGVGELYGEAGKVMKSVDADGLVRGYTPGRSSYQWLEGKLGIDGRVFRSWATRSDTALRRSLLDPTFNGKLYPNYLGPRVFARAGAVLVANVLGQTAEDVAELSAEELAARLGQIMAGQPLTQGVVPVIRSLTDEFQANVRDYAAATQAELPPLGNEAAFIDDLGARNAANLYIAGNAHYRNQPLHHARDVREANEAFFRQIALILLRQGMRALVGVLTDGPGVLVVDVLWTGSELIADYKKLKEDEQMWALATSSLMRSMEDEFRIYDNSIAGLAQLRRGLPPDTARGDIVSYTSISRNGWCWRVWCEQEVVTRMTVRNTGNTAARFRVEACFHGTRNFGYHFISNCIGNIRLGTGETALMVNVPRGGQATFEVVFKDENGHDVRPPDGTQINYYLYAENDTGIFLADQESRELQPSSQLRAGLFSTTASAAAAPTADDTIPHPIYLAAVPGGDGVDQYFHLQAVNGFEFPIQATITQPLPPGGLPVTIPGGGNVSGNAITWKTVIPPREQFAADFAVAVPGKLGEAVTMPPAELSFYLAQEGEMMTFYSADVVTHRRPPWTATAVLPAVIGPSLSTRVEVANETAADTAGVLRLNLYDQRGELLAQTSEAVELCGYCRLFVPLGLQADLGGDAYGLTVEMVIGGDVVVVESGLLNRAAPTQYLPVVVR